MSTTDSAVKASISLYPDHWDIIARHSRALGLRGVNTRSKALQSIIDQWAKANGVFPPIPGVDSLIGLSIRDGKSDPITNPDDITDELPVLQPARIADDNGIGKL